MNHIRSRLETLISALHSHPHIHVSVAKIGLPASPESIATAKKQANGTLPSGVEEFYTQVGSLWVEWQYTGPSLPKQPYGLEEYCGVMSIIPIENVFLGWERTMWFPLDEGEKPAPDPGEDAWRYQFKHVKPFDTHVEGVAACFLMTPDNGGGGVGPGDRVAVYHTPHPGDPREVRQKVSETRYTFEEYIDLMIGSRGFWNWPCSLCGDGQARVMGQAFRKLAPLIFSDIDMSLYKA